MASSPERKRAKFISADRKIGQQSVDSSTGSVFMPGGQRKSARVSARKGRDTEVFVCNDIMFDVFSALDRVQLGLKVALVSGRYNALVANNFKCKKRSLRRLWIRKKEDSKESELVTNFDRKTKPFAETPPPNGINGFKSISISHIDANALAFLEHYRRLFNCDIAFRCGGLGNAAFCALGSHYAKSFRQVWSMFSARIVKTILSRELLLRYRRLISPTVLRDCANLRMINIVDMNIELPANDGKGSAQDKALAKWLYTPRADGRPNVLTTGRRMWKMEEKELMKAIKKEFTNATSGVNFIVRFSPRLKYKDYNFKPFELVNGQTGERMTLRSVDAVEFNCPRPDFRAKSHVIWLLERGPEKRDEQQWTNWAREDPVDPDYWKERASVVYINLNAQRQLGPDVRPKEEYFTCCLGNRVISKYEK